MTADNGESNAWATADNYKSAAIAMAIITPTVAAFALPWVFAAADDATLLQRVQIVGAGVAVGLALVTFATVLWRGTIATEQANLQRIQIVKLAEQMAAANERNLADLLQRGAELLAERQKPAHVAAGIAILQSVAVSDSGTFAIEAMDLLADFVAVEYTKADKMSVSLVSAAQAMKMGARKKRYSRREIRLELNRGDEWRVPIVGVRRVIYKGGAVYDGFLDGMANFDTKYIFQESEFHNCEVGLTNDFRNCYFEGCRIRFVQDMILFLGNKLKNCDLSGAWIRSADDFHQLELLDGNWFDPTDPPICERGAVVWSESLTTTRPDDDFPF